MRTYSSNSSKYSEDETTFPSVVIRIDRLRLVFIGFCFCKKKRLTTNKRRENWSFVVVYISCLYSMIFI